MRLSLRFILPLLLALAVVVYALLPLVDNLTLRWLRRDLNARATLIARTIQVPIQDLPSAPPDGRTGELLNRIAQDEQVVALAYCRSPLDQPQSTAVLPPGLGCHDVPRLAQGAGEMVETASGPLLVSVRELGAATASAGALILVQDLGLIAERRAETRRYLIFLVAGLAILVSLVTAVVAQMSRRAWEHRVRRLLREEGASGNPPPAPPEAFRPIAQEVRALVRDLTAERRPPTGEPVVWTPETLRGVMKRELRGQEVLVVSNREPYIHEREGDTIRVRRPASGLVTALEPIMRACSGTWIAHGGGSADREVVDEHDRVAVPDGDPAYRIRRVWLSEEQEAGYYYGFANEGLWPLCHIAHVRPVFRSADWAEYRTVNQLFARTVVEEATTPDPVILVQDYHFALLPRMIRDMLPEATILTFWHIPWPNPEAFGICPWREELLDGMLGSSILGFHTQAHCNNFVDTVDRFLEARVDRDTFTVSYRGTPTAVKPYPISVAWPVPPRLIAEPIEACRRMIRAQHSLPLDHAIGLGVDRLDYTKGIEERFRAVEQLLRLHPEWVDRFTFIQIAAPTRARIEEYRDYQARVQALADRINTRFAEAARPPIIFHPSHTEPEQVYQYYRASELCFVSSLHDGMNLVAKEFVASRDDERGVLLLSQFTGAARELPEAIVVNPYDADQCASALHLALTMPEADRQARMRLMRSHIREYNIYRWAGRMLMDAAGLRGRRRLYRRSLVAERAPGGNRYHREPHR